MRLQAAARLVAAFAVGAALNLAFAPFGWWPVGLLAPAALFALIRGLPPRRAAGAGFAFGAGLFAFGTYWLYVCLHDFGLVPIWLTLILQVALVALMAAYPALLCFLANRFWLKPGMTREWLVLPALWVLAEWLRGWVLSGFPWLSLGYSLVGTPLGGWAPLLGVYGVSWAAAMACVALTVACGWKMPMARRARAVAVLGVLFVLPLAASRHAWTNPVGPGIPIAIVQGAVSQDQKWQRGNRQATLDRYAMLTDRAWGARLIVWPETALPVLAGNIGDYLSDLAARGRAHDVDIALGLVNYEPKSARYYNGLLMLNSAGQTWYYKRHLVPFGEYFPVPSFVRSWLRLMSLPYDDISPGGAHQPALDAAGQKIGVTICFEDAFGSAQLRTLRQATLLVNVTNNAWYGDSTAPHQHLQISRMRALEAGRYLIRAANDGISAVIDPKGAITAELPQFTQGVLRADVQPMSGLTPYARFGNYPVIALALALLGLAGWRRRQGV
jgi:apolipoprotein N-acyltransferase